MRRYPNTWEMDALVEWRRKWENEWINGFRDMSSHQLNKPMNWLRSKAAVYLMIRDKNLARDSKRTDLDLGWNCEQPPVQVPCKMNPKLHCPNGGQTAPRKRWDIVFMHLTAFRGSLLLPESSPAPQNSLQAARGFCTRLSARFINNLEAAEPP